MIPYSGLYFFYIIALLLLPAIILGLLGKPIKKYGFIVNLVVIAILFGGSRLQAASLLAFYIGELILIKSYLYLRSKFKQRWILWIFVFFSMTPLILVKTSHLFTTKTIGFLGISYLTFKTIQILIETYDGLIKELSIYEFTYFILFFPTISSGPIDRSRRFKTNINKILTREEYKSYLNNGIWKIFTGVAYKFIIGAIISTYWMDKIPQQHNLINTLNYMYSYSLYLFFDFAGYSLMAVGTSYILGVETPDNFNMPFLSRDIKDFWNRWHISLSTWFRDFIYTRFVMSSVKKKWFKNRYTGSYIGYMLTMGTMGIWHGSEIYYIIYGFYHAVLIVATDYFQRKSKWYKKVAKSETWNIVFTFITFNLVCFGFLIFSGYLFKK
jgi:membrane protein involved in D-alanine export